MTKLDASDKFSVMKTLLEDIEAFLAASKMAESTFGRGAVNDGNFMAQFRNGRRVWPETESRIREFMAANKPKVRKRKMKVNK